MANYLKHENQLIVWPALQERLESDLFHSHVCIRARYDMTNQELLDACLDMFEADKEKKYSIVLVRANGEEVELSLTETIAEAGLRNGDPLRIVAA